MINLHIKAYTPASNASLLTVI